MPRGHRAQGIIWNVFGASVSPCTLGDFFLWRARLFARVKSSLRANQWSPADASSHKFRVARRDAAPATSDAQRAPLASIMANQYFYVRARRPRPKTRAGALSER